MSTAADPAPSAQKPPGRAYKPLPPPITDDVWLTVQWAGAVNLWPIMAYPVDSPGIDSPGRVPIGNDWAKTLRNKKWWTDMFKHYPNANVGLKLGAEGGIIDVDVDDPEQAAPVLARIFPEDLPPTLGSDNGERRIHLFFLYDPRFDRYPKRIIKGVMDKATGKTRGNPHYLGLEIRLGAASGNGKQYQTIIPPSWTDRGYRRKWNGHPIILPAPESLFADLDKYASDTPEPDPEGPAPKPGGVNLAPAGGRGTIASNGRAYAIERYTTESVGRELAVLAQAMVKERNDTLNAVAYSVGRFVGASVYDEPTAVRELTAIALDIGLGQAETSKTIASGMRAGKRKPKDLTNVGRGGGNNGQADAKADGQATPAEGDAECSPGMEDNPHRLARLHIQNHYSHPEGNKIRFWRDDHYTWNGSSWVNRPKSEIRGELTNTIEQEFQRIYIKDAMRYKMAQQGGGNGKKGQGQKPPRLRDVTTSKVSDALQAVGGLTLLDIERCPNPPAWTDGGEEWPAHEVLPTRNALVHLPSLVAGKPSTRATTPRFFSTYSLKYDFKSDAPQPVNWLTFLGALPVYPDSPVKLQLWPDDPESINTLQEWFGYQLTPDTRFQKIGALIGPKRSGKGTIASVFEHMIGPENVAGPTLSSLATNFGLSPLIGKPSAIISDARLSGRTDQAVIVERLLAISGEGSLTIDRKHRDAWTGRLPTRFTLISNELPRLSDSSGAFAGRLIILSLTRSFYGREDERLMEKLLPELPGILLWAIAGWQRLYKRGYFVQPDSGRGLVEEMEDLASPIGAYLKERCKVGPGGQTSVDDLHDDWCRWCEIQGRKEPGDKAIFGRNLRAAVPHLKTKQARRDKAIVRVFEGIQLLPETPGEHTAAARWLRSHLATGGRTRAGDVLDAGRDAGHEKDAIFRAVKALRVVDEKYEGRTFWALRAEDPEE